MENKTKLEKNMKGEIQTCRIMKDEVILNKSENQSKFENEVKVYYFDGFNKGYSECRDQNYGLTQ